MIKLPAIGDRCRH